MKKIVILILCGVGIFAAQAQGIGNLDTVFGRYPFYFYNYFDNCWDHDTVHDGMKCQVGTYYETSWSGGEPCNPMVIYDSTLSQPNYILNFSGNQYTCLAAECKNNYNEIAVGFVPDTTVRIIGFAFMRINVEAYRGIFPVMSWLTDTNIYNNAMCNFNLYDKNMQLLQEKSVVNGDLYPARVTPFGRLLMFTGAPQIRSAFFPTYEVFFDQPVDIADTFFLSKTMLYNDSVINPDIFEGFELHFFYEDNHAITCDHRLPVEIRRYRNNIVNGEWGGGKDFGWYLAAIFPIISRACDTCPQVQGLEYLWDVDDKVSFSWSCGVNHHDWQLSYGPSGTAPEDGTIVDCSDPQCVLLTLNPDSHYVAYVRARCRFARDEYGPWSDSISLYYDGGNGIDEVSSNDVTLTPNPAAERVTVSAEGMQSVELLGVDGTVILRREGLQQNEYILDLKGLAAGVYMVRVSTAKGTATRRLMVQ